jgi:zinc ribbon protein
LRVSVCSSCGRGNQAGAKFCSECGAALVAAEPLSYEERKVVTVLFADLVGFTSRAEQMDPEDVRAVLAPFYARLRPEDPWAQSAFPGGLTELVAGDPAAAERHLRKGYKAFHAMEERGYLSSLAGMLAEAVYRQDRLDEAQQLTEEAETLAVPDDFDAQARWRATRAKLLARHGQCPAARQLADAATALVSQTSGPVLLAQTFMDKAEVNRLAGAHDQAAASMHAALQIYEDRQVAPLAEQAKAALASLTNRPGSKSA